MRIVDIIAAKRDGYELQGEDIFQLVKSYAAGEMPDYQMSAFLMAVFLKGMTAAETYLLTRAMVESGEILDLSDLHGVKVDKHSTGGVGDNTTLVVVPVLASLGLVVPKMSGRGLGFTGGTIDKLESIPGFRTDLNAEQIRQQLCNIGAVMAGQSDKMVVADKKIYALRDVTGTVESVPLIASSIMSKKIACGADVILLDVKYGSGAFMSNIDNARTLAKEMIEIGRRFGKLISAVLSNMDQPLGNTVGNSLEVREAVETLQGHGPQELVELCAALSGAILQQAGIEKSKDAAVDLARRAIKDGAALQKLAQIVEAQDGDEKICENPTLLTISSERGCLFAQNSGYLSKLDSKVVGKAAALLGSGRERKEDKIDHGAGIVLKAKVGDRVEQGQILAELFAEEASRIESSLAVLKESVEIGVNPVNRADKHETVKI